MDDTAQDPNSKTAKYPLDTQQADVARPVINPVSSFNKERGGVSVDYVRPSEQEPNIPAEVKAAGVEKVSERPKLDEIHEQIGVKHSGETVPVNTQPTPSVKLPMTEEEAKADIKIDKQGVNLDFREHGREDAYIVPSRLFLSTLVLKVLDRVKLLKGK